jgi:hypothetical protein
LPELLSFLDPAFSLSTSFEDLLEVDEVVAPFEPKLVKSLWQFELESDDFRTVKYFALPAFGVFLEILRS